MDNNDVVPKFKPASKTKNSKPDVTKPKQDIYSSGFDDALARDIPSDSQQVTKGQVSRSIITVLDTYNIPGDVLPSSDNIFDVGSATKRWSEGRFVALYLGSGTSFSESQLATLTDGSNADGLHTHSSISSSGAVLFVIPDGTDITVETNYQYNVVHSLTVEGTITVDDGAEINIIT